VAWRGEVEMLELVNASEMGPAAHVFAGDLQRAERPWRDHRRVPEHRLAVEVRAFIASIRNAKDVYSEGDAACRQGCLSAVTSTPDVKHGTLRRENQQTPSLTRAARRNRS
jgi:hypothetical protein